MNLFRSLTPCLLAASLLGLALPAQANMLRIADDMVTSTPGAKRTFAELATNDAFYTRLIRGLVPETTKTVTAGLFRKALRLQVGEFVAKGFSVSWKRSDIVDFMKNMVGKKCTATVSCQIAFDLTVSGVDGFVDEIGETIAKAADPKIAGIQSKIDAAAKEIMILPEGSPAHLAKQEEMMKIIDEIAPLEQTSQAAKKLLEKTDGMDLIKSNCTKS